MHPQHYTYRATCLYCVFNFMFAACLSHFAEATRTTQEVEQPRKGRQTASEACGKPFLTAEFMAPCKYFSWSETSFLRQPLRHSRD
jgi:hypothetical protein